MDEWTYKELMYNREMVHYIYNKLLEKKMIEPFTEKEVARNE